MIRHVVLWKLKPEAAAPEVLAQNLAQIYRNCQRMVGNAADSPLFLLQGHKAG